MMMNSWGIEQYIPSEGNAWGGYPHPWHPELPAFHGWRSIRHKYWPPGLYGSDGRGQSIIEVAMRVIRFFLKIALLPVIEAVTVIQRFFIFLIGFSPVIFNMLYWFYIIRDNKIKHPKSYDTTPETSKRMAHVKLKGGKGETAIAKKHWHERYRYRLNYKKLPGSPDIAMQKYHIAIFVDGEFWHGFEWEKRKKKESEGFDNTGLKKSKRICKRQLCWSRIDCSRMDFDSFLVKRSQERFRWLYIGC